MPYTVQCINRKRTAKANFVISFTFENAISDAKLESIDLMTMPYFMGLK